MKYLALSRHLHRCIDMPVLKADEIRKMSREERLRRLEELRAELIRLRTQSSRGTIDNPARIREIRKAIARILTIENEEARKKGSQ